MSLRTRIASYLQPPGAPAVEPEARYGWLDYLNDFVTYSFNGNVYTIPTTVKPSEGEAIENSFPMYVSRVYKANGPAFAVIQARINLLSEVRFKFRNQKTGEIYGSPALKVLENPWPNGTTGELIARMEQDVSLAGNFYGRKTNDRIRRMSPEKVRIVLSSTAGTADEVNDLNSEIAGYAYYPQGDGHSEKNRAIILLPDEVIHWSPIPDPSAMYRGMSWLSPVIREVQSDGAATEAIQKFFENGMTPNMVVKFPESITSPEKFKELRDAMNDSHAGVDHAYKTLYLAAGADATVVGSNLQASGLKDVQAAGETRITAAGRVPSVIAGLKEGLEAATYSNFAQARRLFADGFGRPQWRSMCAALAHVVEVPPGSELWYDESAVAMLRDDAKEAAETSVTQATAITTLVNGGFEAKSAVAAVKADDMSLLKHTGLLSVQLQDPTAAPPEPADPPVPDPVPPE